MHILRHNKKLKKLKKGVAFFVEIGYYKQVV